MKTFISIITAFTNFLCIFTAIKGEDSFIGPLTIIKQSSSSLVSSSSSSLTTVSFKCPEQFGYYPDKSNCSKYYVCVFGEHLHESCTGGLHFSQELQTCDWPRNVECLYGTLIKNVRTNEDHALFQYGNLDDANDDRTGNDKQIDAKSVSSQTPDYGAEYTFDDTSRKLSKIIGNNNHQQQLASLFVRKSLHSQTNESDHRWKETSEGVPNIEIMENEQKQKTDDFKRTLLKTSALNNNNNNNNNENSQIIDYDRNKIIKEDLQNPAFDEAISSIIDESGRIHLHDGPGGLFSLVPPDTIGTSDHNVNVYLKKAIQDNRYKDDKELLKLQKKENIRGDKYDSSGAKIVYFDDDDESDSLSERIRTELRSHSASRPRGERIQSQSIVLNSDNGPITVKNKTQTSPSSTQPLASRLPRFHQQQRLQQQQYFNQQRTVNSYQSINGDSDDKKDEISSKIESNKYRSINITLPLNITTSMTSTTSTPIISPSSSTSAPTIFYSYRNKIYDNNNRRSSTMTTPMPSSRVSLTDAKRKDKMLFIKTKPTDVTIDASQIPSSPTEPSRPKSIYPTPDPLFPATKCNDRVCRLPDCLCGGTEIPVGLRSEEVPQIVTITFDDAVNDVNWQIYEDIFDSGRKNPNGCPIRGTFYVSHEWTDYGQVQTLYSRGHEIASHSITHSFGEGFSKSQWQKEIAGQREILHLYGGVRMEDIRGMRAPFLQIGGNKQFEMLYEANFTYDSSMSVFENSPPYWPYTLDYAINHECMIAPCPTRSFPGLWEIGLIMWHDLRGGRCSMGDACSNPPDENGIFQMIMKNFNRHYKSNRAPFGLYYHSAWFNTDHHKRGFLKFIDTVLKYNDVYFVTNWQLIQWMRQPIPLARIHEFRHWQCHRNDYELMRSPQCLHPTVCNVRSKSGSRFFKTCQQCPVTYPWIGNTGFKKSKN